MRTSELIIKKRDGAALRDEEISYLVNGYVEGTIPDYQMAAWCMAVFLQGMTPQETTALTLAMANSGERVDLSLIPGIKVDKHSTGGVADTTTLILAPLVAAGGVPVAKMSGRGLGHTGGTIDKLESVPGLTTNLPREDFIRQVRTIGAAVVGQSGNLVPADKKLYALRDVTGTVDSIPLIASSIMSKKIAAGADALVLDVKTGAGAFMRTREDAFRLAETMVSIGESAGRETVAVVSDMNEPLGSAVGNALEVEEAISVLQGETRGRLREISLYLGSHMLCLGRQAKSMDEARRRLEYCLDQGLALQKFYSMIEAQKGNPQVVHNTKLLPQAMYRDVLKADSEGWFVLKDARALGLGAMVLGAGRETKESAIDLAVGLRIHARTGDFIKADQPLVTFYCNDSQKLPQARQIVKEGIEISSEAVAPRPLLYGIVTKMGREFI